MSPVPSTEVTGEPPEWLSPPRFAALPIASTVRVCGTSATLDPDLGTLGNVRAASFQGGSSSVETSGGDPLQGVLLRLCQTLLCRPVGLAHGPDHARLRCHDCLAPGLEIAPQTAGALKTGGVASTVRFSTPDSPPRRHSCSQTRGGPCNNPAATPTPIPPCTQTRGWVQQRPPATTHAPSHAI
jgi:hypothetical protein